MTAPKKSAAKSGDNRQPRLQDLQRLEEKYDALTGKVDLLIDLQRQDLKSPFAGLDFEQALCGLAFAMTATQPGGTSADYMVAQRVKHAIRGLRAVMTGDDSLLQDKPKKREKIKAGGVTTHVRPSTSESVVPDHSMKSLVNVRPPQMPVK